MWDHTIGILVGGQSRRMGTPKEQIKLPCGKTMLELMLEFASCTAIRTVIVGGDLDGYESVHDQRTAQGPVAGLESLLDSNIDDRYLLVGCDMPLLTTNIVEPLFHTQETAAIFTHDEMIIGLPLMISAGSLPDCTAYLNDGKRSIKGFISKINHTSIPVTDEIAESLTSINTPDDLNNFTLK